MKLYTLSQLPNLISDLRLKPKSCVAFIFCEDTSLIDETLEFSLKQNFAKIFLFITEPEQYRFGEKIYNCQIPSTSNADIWSAINQALPSLRNCWLYWGLNGEFFYYPFCETRTVYDLSDFLESERRQTIFGTTVDLYAGDLELANDGVSIEDAYFDKVNYFSEDGQIDDEDMLDEDDLQRIKYIYGGLRWRFMEHVPLQNRRIDRIPFFYVTDVLRFDEDGIANNPEFYTYRAVHHYSPTCVVASFHMARYLRHNHELRQKVHVLKWEGSQQFNWNSSQFLRAGFFETGQWF